MKLPHPDRILQHFLDHPGKQYTAADLREYLLVPRRDRTAFKRRLDTLVREGVLQLSQKKYYRLVETQRVAPSKRANLGAKVVRRREGTPLHRSEFGSKTTQSKIERKRGASEVKSKPLSRRSEGRREKWDRRRFESQREEQEYTFSELTRLFLSRAGLQVDFSAEIHADLDATVISIEDELKWREDLRSLYTLCIDPVGARDHDDAISAVARSDGGWELWVHIADVSHYVREGSALDLEARDRGFTQYLPWQAVPMLPAELSAGECSLVVGQDRLAFSCQMQISPYGDVEEYRFVKTVINVDDDPHYELALQMADEGERACSDLRAVSRLLRKRREKGGILELNMPEAKVEFDKANEPIRIDQRVQIESMLWIEDCMLITNQCCALFMKERKVQGIYRIHPPPIPQDITELYSRQPDLFRNTGFSPRALYDIEMGDGEGSAVVPQLFELFKRLVINAGNDVEKRRMVLRAMQKARYSTMPQGHFALSWPDYAHFTAPIRRYSDLWCHRVMALSIEGRRRRRYKGVEEMAEIISEREIEVMKNERQGVKLCAVWIVKDRVGELFHGKITGLSEWGMWVELLGTGAEGVVRYESIRDDWYSYDPEKERAIGRRKHRFFQRGDALKVQLVRVNLERYELDLEPAEEELLE